MIRSCGTRALAFDPDLSLQSGRSLSPAYDTNLSIDRQGLSLAINEVESGCDVSMAKAEHDLTAPDYGASTLTLFRRPAAPDMIVTAALVQPKCSATKAMSS